MCCMCVCLCMCIPQAAGDKVRQDGILINHHSVSHYHQPNNPILINFSAFVTVSICLIVSFSLIQTHSVHAEMSVSSSYHCLFDLSFSLCHFFFPFRALYVISFLFGQLLVFTCSCFNLYAGTPVNHLKSVYQNWLRRHSTFTTSCSRVLSLESRSARSV